MLILTGHADSDAKVKKDDVVRFLVKHSMFVLKRKLQQADKTLGVGQELIATWVADTLLTTAEGMQPSSTTLSQHHLIKHMHWSLVLDPLLKQLLPPPPPPLLLQAKVEQAPQAGVVSVAVLTTPQANVVVVTTSSPKRALEGGNNDRDGKKRLQDTVGGAAEGC
jgi:hypothetical protein